MSKMALIVVKRWVLLWERNEETLTQASHFYPLRPDLHLKILHINLHTLLKAIVERVRFEDQTRGIIALNVLHR